MPAHSITARYLDRFKVPMLPLPESSDAKIKFAGRYLSRPVFLDAAQLRGLERDLALARSALCSLPRRVFGGDLRAFARDVGMTEFQADCVVRSMGPGRRSLTHATRADLYQDASGFRLLEWNIGSTIGGIECVDICRTLADIPELAAFLAEEGLGYADTVAELLGVLRSETGYLTSPVVALVETPESFPYMEPIMRCMADRFTRSGLPSVIGHLGQLSRTGNRLRLENEPVDIIYRLFMIEDVVDHATDGLLEPLLQSVERGDVVMFTPLDAELYGSKGALAWLSEPWGLTGLPDLVRAACERLLPWTRRARPGPVRAPDGEAADLLCYAREHKDDLVLKPSFSYGGYGVVMGADCGPGDWDEYLTRALAEPYVVQWRVRPAAEPFPVNPGQECDDWTVAWGVFMMRRGYAGTFVRAIPADARGAVVNLSNGSVVTGGFHQRL
jgi:hypothetical protein